MSEALARTRQLAGSILDEIERAVVGKREVLELVLLGLIADGHVLLDDVPGVAKTLTARSLATVTGLAYRRVQFTPDLLPADITGSVVLDPEDRRPQFRAGPVFANLVLGDEINRAPAKTQAALLEAMQERQVTADGVTHPLPRPFLVIATQNPIEQEGTYPLPEAQLDRFLLATSLGYPSGEDEWSMLAQRLARATDEVDLRPVTDPPGVLGMQRSVESVHLSEPVGRYIVALATASREDAQVEVGVSPRGTLALAKLARARAALSARDYVLPDDVKAVAVPALAHRLVLKPELWVRRVRPQDVVSRLLDRVPAPVEP